MRVYVFCSILFFALSSPLWASSVRGNSLTSPTVYASNTGASYLGMVAEGPTSGSGEAEGTPYKAYIPLGSTAATQEVCTIVSNGALLPEPPTLSPASSDGFIKIDLNLTNDSGSTQTLYAAVRDGTTTYETFTLSTTTSIASSSNTVTSFSVIFSLANLCTYQSASCFTISTSATNGQREGELLVYFFLDSTAHAANEAITTTTSGVFYSIKISDKMPSGNYDLIALRKGDERLVAEVKDGDLITQMGSNLYKTMVFNYTCVSVNDECPGTAVAAGRGSIYSLESAVLNGFLTIKGLTNDTPYTFSMALVNKYQFTTGLNNAVTETPQTIEALLRANACFLLTAGFDGNHPAIDYFRNFRDQVLLGSFWGGSLGKALVAVYYSYGPKLARQIIENNSYSPIDFKSWIRTTAMAVQGIMQLFWSF